MYCACKAGSVSWLNSLPPTSLGAMIKYIRAKVVMSKIELVGPIQSMKLAMDDASHLRGGTRKNSSSTLSQGSDIQEMS